MTGYDPTDEQTDCLGIFLAGVNLAIQAGAGTGKTSTLEMIGRNTRANGSYVAFNRSISAEAKHRMPMNIAASTLHSVAFRAWGNRYAHRLDAPRVKSWELAKILDVGPVVVRVGAVSKVLQPAFLASHVMRGIRNFCQSADPAPTPWHLPTIPGLDPHPSENVSWEKSTRNNDNLRAHLADAVTAAWADLTSTTGRLPYTPAAYLKEWSLGEPVIPGEFVMVDEAQDLSGVMLRVVEHQIERGTQVVLVGDSAQAIYGWTGAVDAMQKLPTDATAYLTRSFRFGPAIADLANLILADIGADLRLTGNPDRVSSIGYLADPDVVLCRSNSAALEHLLHAQKAGKHAHLIGGGGALLSFAKGVHDLQTKGRSFHPDLACFDSWQEVKTYTAEDPSGSDLALMVRLIEEYGLQIVMDSLDGMMPENAADVVVGTAHAVKGREWSKVKLAGDFPEDGTRGDDTAERMLLYVGATRARDVLDVGACEAIRSLLQKPTPVAIH